MTQCAVKLTEQSSTPLFPLGSVYKDALGCTYVYAQAHAAAEAGSFLILPNAGTYHAIDMTTSDVGTPGTNWKALGVACCDLTADYYGWLWTGNGYFECIIENNFAAADVIYTTATGGIPGTNSSSHILDGFKTIDAGVTETRVTCFAVGRLTAGMIACCD